MADALAELAAPVAAWLAASSIQALILAGVVWSVERVAGRRLDPLLLCGLWALVAVKLLLPPTWSAPTSAARLAPPEAVGALTGTVAVEPAPVLSALWAAGMLAALALLWTAGRRESRRCLETARPAPPGIEESARLAADLLRLHEPPRIVVSDTLSVPAVVGVFRPIVVLPPGLAERETKERLLHVLLHEFAHVGRRDPLWGALVRLLVAAYWFHPAAWAAERRLALHRALLCDRSVARALGQPEAYQRTLVQFALQASCGRAALRTALMGRAPEVLQRVSALTRAGPPIVLRRVAALTLAAAVFLPMAPATLSAAGLLLLSRERPPGCLAFRHAVLLRLAAEEETR